MLEVGASYFFGMNPDHARELLARGRARIEHALGDLTAHGPDDAADRIGPGDSGEDLFDEELAQAQAERLREELEAIERAERRLAEGAYGISVESGEPIPDGRLEAIPWAERTAEEQARYESGR